MSPLKVSDSPDVPSVFCSIEECTAEILKKLPTCRIAAADPAGQLALAPAPKASPAPASASGLESTDKLGVMYLASV